MAQWKLSARGKSEHDETMAGGCKYLASESDLERHTSLEHEAKQIAVHWAAEQHKQTQQRREHRAWRSASL